MKKKLSTSKKIMIVVTLITLGIMIYYLILWVSAAYDANTARSIYIARSQHSGYEATISYLEDLIEKMAIRDVQLDKLEISVVILLSSSFVLMFIDDILHILFQRKNKASFILDKLKDKNDSVPLQELPKN